LLFPLVVLSGRDADPGVFTLGSDAFLTSTGAGRSAKYPCDLDKSAEACRPEGVEVEWD
jgi:hypothetical protein